MNDRIAVRDVLDRLSFGARMRLSYDVQRHQLVAGMRAQLEGRQSIDLPLTTFFASDPVAEVDSALAEGMFLVVRTPGSRKSREDRSMRKEALKSNLEALRLKKRAAGVTFDQELEQEYRGRFDAIIARARELR